MTNRASSSRYQRTDRTLCRAAFACGDTLQAGGEPEGDIGGTQWDSKAQHSMGGSASWRSRLERQGRWNGRRERPCDNRVLTDGSTGSLDLSHSSHWTHRGVHIKNEVEMNPGLGSHDLCGQSFKAYRSGGHQAPTCPAADPLFFNHGE